MNNKPNPDRSLLHFMLRAQQIAQQDGRSDKGYAMLIVSFISIAMFSMLAAYTTLTNLSKSSTNAYVDGTNSFYVAESGLNKRANELRQKFEGSTLPAGTEPAIITSCFPLVIADNKNTSTFNPDNDFECRNYRFQHSDNSAILTSSNGNTEVTNTNNQVKYVAYTFVKPRQNYVTNPATPETIDSGQPYAGLKALEYKYTVYSTAKKPTSVNLVASTADAAEIAAKSKKLSGVPTSPAENILAASYDTKQAAADAINTTNAGTAAGNSSVNTVLQMDFKSKVIPLFQFAAFYENDLEINSITQMTISGPVHTNGNLKAISYNSASVGDFTQGIRFMDKVTVVEDVYNNTPFSSSCSNCKVSVYDGTGGRTLLASYGFFPNPPDLTTRLTTTQLDEFGTRLKTRQPRLNVPAPGFLREKNYKTGETGLYYGKADLRLKFFPTRAMPFDLTSIQTGSGCSLTTFKIPSDRQSASALSCRVLTKGQLQSLRQPVLTKSTSAIALSPKNEEILKALRVAIASSPTPVTLSDLEQPINTGSGWGQTFKDQLNLLPTSIITSAEIDTLLPTTGSPAIVTTLLPLGKWPSPSPSPSAPCTVSTLLPSGNAKNIVRALCSTFLTAPIQQIQGTVSSTDRKVNVGFYDQNNTTSGSFSITNGEWMQMLQLNIESLTYWNRDGIYVEAATATLTTPYAAPTTLTLASGLSTANLAFIKAAANTSQPVGSFAEQGLAANDPTEGGLVFHATVSDDLNGDGTDDTTATGATAANKVPGKDNNGVVIPHVDNYRIYPSGSAIRKSPYGFVLSGGVELPGPLTIATDQPAYIQGDYNNPGVAPGSLDPTTFYNPSDLASDDRGFRRQPAAIMADTLTFLSNQCLNDNQQVNCGNRTLVTATSLPKVTNGIAINAALLSNIMKSTSSATFNGGLNKYMKHLENWDRVATLNYTGSMISLGEPLESAKISVSDNSVYRRNYNYDTNFNSFGKLPPLSPTVVYLQQDVFRRTY